MKHIEKSCCPWNSPIFVIKKKSNTAEPKKKKFTYGHGNRSFV